MTIKLSPSWRIEVDEMNCTLIERVQVKKKDSVNTERDKVIGYYRTIEDAVRKYLFLVSLKPVVYETILEYVQELNRSNLNAASVFMNTLKREGIDHD